MARVTLGRPKAGRHPAMWQSVPMESFIQPSVSQHLISKENNEHSANPDYSKKDINGSKYFLPKKKAGIYHGNNNNRGLLSSENVEDKGSDNNSNHTCQTKANFKPHSGQRHHSNFSKSPNNATFYAPSQNMTFLSNEDDFPSLCSSNSSGVTESAASVLEASLSVSTSYSEKLKHIHHTPQQNKVEGSNASVEKETPSNSHQRNYFNHNLSKHDKKSSTEHRRNYPVTSIPTNRDVSNSQWHISHKNNKKSTYTDSRNGSVIDQACVSPMRKTLSESQRGKIHHSYMNVKENTAVGETGDQKIPSFLSKTQGNTVSNSCNTKLKDIGEQGKVDSSDNKYAEIVKSDLKKDFSPSLKLASKNKRLMMDEMKEKCCSFKVPNDCENVPHVGKMRTSVKSNTLRPAKIISKYPATGEVKAKGISSDLPSNRESAGNSQQGTTAKAPKKKRNRKSKLKRNLAFQTGKIMILTPELYSRFTGNLTSSHSSTARDFSFDLSDMEEYPELGQVSSLCSDQPKKTTKAEFMDSLKNHECDPAANFVDVAPEQLIPNEEITSENASNGSKNTSLHKSIAGAIAKTEQGIQDVTDEMVEIHDKTCKKSCCLPRKRMATLESEKISANEEKESSSGPEQKPKIRHDGSIQISFSDFLSSSMVKVKSERSKSRKQNDSRIKVISSKKVKMDKNLLSTPNALDSSRPVVKRGKERERPKPKKHTALKRIILKERNEKKQRRNVLVKQENLKNEVSCQKVEEQDIFPTDKEGETETEVDAEDLDDSLCNYLIIEEYASESCEGVKEERPDENLNITVEAVNEPPSEKTEETCGVLPEEKKMQAIQIALHTRHFREYCNHLLSAEIDQITLSLLGDLTRFQDRLHQKDPVKARIKRRLVYGIKEVTKHLKLKKVKCVILAPDSENIKSKGGLNDAVSEIVRVSAEYHVPCIFALRRKSLGKACLKPVPVACVGVFNYDGSEANFKKLIELQVESRKAYDAVMTNLKERITEEDIEQLIETQENSPRSLQDLRVTILRETLLEKNPDLHLVFTPSGNVQLGRKEEE